MKRINSEKIFNELKRITLRFPLTIIFTLLLTGWQLYSEESIWLFEPTFLLLVIGIIFSATSQLFYERFFQKRPKMRWILYRSEERRVGKEDIIRREKWSKKR